MMGAVAANSGRRKVCRSCHEMRPLETDFYKNPSTSDGYRSTCKSCERVKRTAAPAGEVVPHLHHTPYGLAECDRCQKLIPLTEDGELEPHFRMAELNPGGVYVNIKRVRCESE